MKSTKNKKEKKIDILLDMDSEARNIYLQSVNKVPRQKFPKVCSNQQTPEESRNLLRLKCHNDNKAEDITPNH